MDAVTSPNRLNTMPAFLSVVVVFHQKHFVTTVHIFCTVYCVPGYSITYVSSYSYVRIRYHTVIYCIIISLWRLLTV
jgi:hypothetical protein